MDISDTLVAKSDQINAEDLVSGPITAKIVGVSRNNDEQPVTIELDGGLKQPNGKWKVWRPCKTMRRLMVLAWPDCVKPAVAPNTKQTIDPTVWVGRSVTLIRDPSVRWGKDIVGGTRIAALSHITTKIEVALAESKGKKKLVTVEKLDVAATGTEKPQSNREQSAVQNELQSAFNAMGAKWRSRREDRGLSILVDDFKAFVVHATDGLIAADKALSVAAYTPDVIAKCVEVINFEMPEQG